MAQITVQSHELLHDAGSVSLNNSFDSEVSGGSCLVTPRTPVDTSTPAGSSAGTSTNASRSETRSGLSFNVSAKFNYLF